MIYIYVAKFSGMKFFMTSLTRILTSAGRVVTALPFLILVVFLPFPFLIFLINLTRGLVHFHGLDKEPTFGFIDFFPFVYFLFYRFLLFVISFLCLLFLKVKT